MTESNDSSTVLIKYFQGLLNPEISLNDRGEIEIPPKASIQVIIII
jgi:hypothetical protein